MLDSDIQRIHKLNEKIKKSFPRCPIPSFESLVYSPESQYSDTVDIHKGIKDKAWDEIEEHYYELNCEFTCWLTPLGIYYYLPGVMLYSLKEYELSQREAFVLIHTESSFMNDVDSILSYFNNEQLAVVLEWAEILSLDI